MKRVKSACVYQTLVFLQKDDCGLSPEEQLRINREEVEKYRASLEKNGTLYQILDVTEESDSSVVVHVRKQLNSSTAVGEYFQ